MITQEILKSLLNYTPETGLFKWKVSRPPRGVIGAIAGFNNGSGYIKISIGGKKYYAHRLAFLWVEGEIPKMIDHINHCRSDNRWENIREIDSATNCANVSGRRGLRKRGKSWEVRYGDKLSKTFSTEREATEFRKELVISKCGHDPDLRRVESPQKTKPRKQPVKKFLGKSLSEWSRETGVPQPTLYYRVVKKGVSIEQAVNMSKQLR